MPICRLANVRLPADSETGGIPVPERATESGLFLAVSVTVSVAVRLPRAGGVNVTVMLQLCLTPRVLGLRGQFPPQAKSVAAFPPAIAMLVIVTGTVLRLLNLAILALLVWPATSLPKARLEGVKVFCANTDEPMSRRHMKANAPRRTEPALGLARANFNLCKKLVGVPGNMDPAKITDPLDFPNGPIELSNFLIHEV